MVKKNTNVVIEELPSDSGNEEYFDEDDFSFDEDESDAPEAVNLKDAKLKYEKIIPGKSSKSKAVAKKNKSKKA